MTKTEQLQEQINALPHQPGVYQYLDKEGTIIYVGKAKDLRKRVASYFVNDQRLNAKTRLLVRKIITLQYIVTDTELDALLLENNLIKKNQPKYNIQLKDGKTYPWICIKKEPFPRVTTTRKIEKDGAEYFGPYASGKMLHAIMDLIKKTYPLRTCNFNLSPKPIEEKKYKVCLEYHIGNCKAPCIGEQHQLEYLEYITSIRNIIKGNLSGVIGGFKEQMDSAAQDLDFEKAQEYKEKITVLENYQSKSAVVSPSINNVDVFNFAMDDKWAYVNFLRVVNGAIIQGHTMEIRRGMEQEIDSCLVFALLECVRKFGNTSKEIILPIDLDPLPIEGAFTHIPQRGDKKKLLDMSERNARFFMLEKHKQERNKNPERNTERIMNTMKKDLRLSVEPRHIECFDNSNFHGTNAVAACVVFKDGKPSKRDYRHFNIKTVVGPDDFASMEEVVYRRYKRLLDEKLDLPDLIIVDGGKGQLGSALNALEKLELRGKVAIVGIAKRLEEIFFPGDSLPLYIDKRSESLKIIQYLRNEAHRFGITHHRDKRSKNAIQIELTEIKGIGEKTAMDLIRHFKSMSFVKEASLDAMAQIVGKAKAKVVFNHYNETQS